MGLVGEDGRPVEAANDVEATPPEGDTPESVLGKVPPLVIQYTEDGSLSIKGPGDIRLVLQMLNEAKDMVMAKQTMGFVLSRLAAAQIQKPGMADVLAFSKLNKR